MGVGVEGFSGVGVGFEGGGGEGERRFWVR